MLTGMVAPSGEDNLGDVGRAAWALSKLRYAPSECCRKYGD